MPAPKSVLLTPLALRFETASKYVQQVGLSEFATYMQTGETEAVVQFPWSLRFVPADVADLFPADTYEYTFEQYL